MAGYNMDKIFFLKNRIQPYAWGSHTAIYELLGKPPLPDVPAAELWMGAHPKASSLVKCDDREVPLLSLLEEYPRELLGEKCVQDYDGKLPFLFKVLAAELPLSIQAHPDLKQAEEGFRRETSLGIAADAFERTYKDPNHKPEIICALTPFWALNGFLPYTEIIGFFRELNVPFLEEALDSFAASKTAEGFKNFYRFLMELAKDRKEILVTGIVAYAGSRQGKPRNDWLVKIHSQFPGDPGLISAALLNLVLLQPGEAMYLPARQLHAYLQGVGIELMANSDNVLRGGLTPKYVNVGELLEILHFNETIPERLHPEPSPEGEEIYITPAREFRLSRIELTADDTFREFPNPSASLLLCVRGEGTVSTPDGDKEFPFQQGQSFFVAASLAGFRLKGNAELFAARVPATL